MALCGKCGQSLAGGLVVASKGEHVVCPTPDQIARARRLGRGPAHLAQLTTLYPVGSRGRYV